ncbi:hypothetical protein Caci_7106 [Catenulispora acidiphila DSM 44928]|uniref:DUF3558 domain-containing protein n=1 Tax=Catenulispora acidiphila (strain DSM 44928 / JCM 14897 / NBRC 102108 / NRRL B-24433 / ID139908) TaxID=479433 RepID=C7Q5G7_CATAD|nr:hypothetical protein [Catenulispora acidiphila]ACU75936.1 hypothetical protein Caci_7106 [Catenulispora acidiphila DSM 44928]
MSWKTWGIVGAVVVLAAAGTATALLLRGGGTTDYKTLPTCEKLSAAVAGKPAFKVGQNVTDASDIRGLHPAYTNIRCVTDDETTSVEVDLYQASDMDLVTAHKYADQQVHDGTWRANNIFTRDKLTELTPDITYGSLGFANATCTVEQVKHNAEVMLTVPMPKTTSLEQWNAQCKQIAQQQMPKVIKAAL